MSHFSSPDLFLQSINPCSITHYNYNIVDIHFGSAIPMRNTPYNYSVCCIQYSVIRIYHCPKLTPLSPLLELEASRVKWRHHIWNYASSAAAQETSRLFAYLAPGTPYRVLHAP